MDYGGGLFLYVFNGEELGEVCMRSSNWAVNDDDVRKFEISSRSLHNLCPDNFLVLQTRWELHVV